MTITITIPDEIKERVETAFANTYGYRATIIGEKGEEINNTQTKADFFKDQLVRRLKNIVKNYESMKARELAEVSIDKDLANIT